MDKDRRGFLTAATALAASQLPVVGAAADSAYRDGRKPITKPEMYDLASKMFGGQFTCIRTPESNDGPFYYESSPRRRDVTEGRKGMKVRLGIRIANAAVPGNSCAPLAGAVVDIWHADADGIYSNVGGDLQTVPTLGKTFMRGHQLTDANGLVEFDTVVPGWELVTAPAPQNVVLRATHIHVKVFHESKIATTQLYFPDEFLDELYASVDPYQKHRQMTAPGAGRNYDRIRNGQDNLFLADQSKPLSIQRQGDSISALATVGLVSMGTQGIAPRFR
jgi:protocatechuate 3,4-dioxygenase beta subunit